MEHSAGTQGLLNRIALDEDSFLELKELTIKGAEVLAPAPESLAEELAAMANAHGGVCLLGVRGAPREIVGIELESLDDAETWVRNICADLIVPPLAPSIARVALPGPDGTRRAILKVDVPRSLFVHESPGGYFRRVGSSKRKMPPDYLARLFQQRAKRGSSGSTSNRCPGRVCQNSVNTCTTAFGQTFRLTNRATSS